MRKIFILLVLCLMLSANICLAADDSQPVINAKNKKFDIFSATYVLKGDVYIQHKQRTVKADYAEYSLLSQQVKASGNIIFTDGGFTASCQSLTAHILDENVDLLGNVDFKQGQLRITSARANFNWGTKIADFSEDVKIKEQGRSRKVERATYNVTTGALKF